MKHLGGGLTQTRCPPRVTSHDFLNGPLVGQLSHFQFVICEHFYVE